MKKLLLSLLFALVALTGLQAQTIWNGTADTEWYNETSTEFEISTAEQLAGLAKLVNNGNNFSGKTIMLTADIVLNDTSNWGNWESSAPNNTWTPIGANWNSFFSGTFDGQGHTVSGIYNNSENFYQGLFGYNQGIIKNIGVRESYIKGDSYVGGVCGFNDNGTITNCYNSGTINGTLVFYTSIGGVCGNNYSGTISNCYNTGTVSGTGEYASVGGVCGSNNGTISNCYNTGTVSGTGESTSIGGVCGSNHGTISNCYNSGTVNGIGENSYIGGVCGYNHGTIANCYNIGNVSGDYYVGGVCGFNEGTISDCYNSGTLNGNRYIGGVCGYNYGSVSNCYYLQGTAEGGIEGSDVGGQAEVKTSKQFASGEVCWWLNGNSDQNPIWFQTLDTDAYPVWDNTHATVYAIGNCPNDINNTYSNQGSSQVGAHTDTNNDGRCDFCGKIMTSEPAQKDGIYQISNRAELYWFAGLVNGTLSGVEQNLAANAVLTRDIVINENVLDADGILTDNAESLFTWTTIAYYDDPFHGTFDGQGHIISGIYDIANYDEFAVGLFGYNTGSIINLGIEDSYILYKYDDIVTNVGGLCGINEGTISNCYNTGTVNGGLYVGGLCGSSIGTISNCYNTGSVSGNGNKDVGGVCGFNEGTISDCYNSGNVSGTGEYTKVGGVCGSSIGTISNCYYLEGTAEGGINGSDVSGQAEVKTAEQFASGEVCWLLNEEQSEGAWGQKIGTDPCPVLGGPAVFKDGETYYNEEGSAIVETNSEQASFAIVSENLTINIYGSDHEATVYNLAGNIVYKGSERIIPVTTAGMYLVRIGNEVQKTIVR